MRETINFVPSKSTPNHKEVQYWIDLQTDPYGRCIKAWTGSEWSTITEGYKKKLVYNAAFDILPPIDETFGGNTTTYWCDYNWTNNSTTDRLTLIGGNAGDGAYAGLLGVSSNAGLGDASARVGSRLTYIP